MLDTAALIAWPISELSGGLIVSHQEDELIRISPDRAALLESMGLVFCRPNQDSIDLALDAAKQSGDISGISAQILELNQILDETKTSAVIQITALRREIDKMNKKLKPLGLISTSRTGAVAMTRGAKIFN